MKKKLLALGLVLSLGLGSPVHAAGAKKVNPAPQEKSLPSLEIFFSPEVHKDLQKALEDIPTAPRPQGRRKGKARGQFLQKTNQAISIDGVPSSTEVYLIENRTYMRLRDVAALLKNTESAFNVGYDGSKNQVVLTNHQAYTPLAGDLQPLNQGAFQGLSNSNFLIDGETQFITTAIVNNNNFVQLRDLSKYVDFRVDYKSDQGRIEIYTSLRERLKGKIDEKYLTDRFYSLVDQGLTYREAELAERVNAYRRQLGLAELSLSKSLTQVARTHVKDTETYRPDQEKDVRGIQGTLHSWSPNGPWTPVVYTSDHQYSKRMWSKPRELTSYTGSGFEISALGYGSPEAFLAGWKGSAPHNAVLAGQGYWGNLKCMGIGIGKSASHIWFGADPDPAGYYWENSSYDQF